jgi:purine nucleosidase
MIRVQGLFALFALAFATAAPIVSRAQAAPSGQGTAEPKQLVILDTDIGDDIDDAFALALVLRSPEVQVLGITTDFGDTELRARLVDRYLTAIGRSNIPVEAGKLTPHSNVFTQATYAEHEPARKHGDGVQFLLDQIKAHPGQITLIAIGPFVNVGEAIKRDPQTFRKVKRVVVMGGSVYRGYDAADSNHTAPQPEWNIARDPEGAMALLAVGVPVYMMPLDSTQIHLDEADRERLFAYGSPLTDQLTLLYHQWVANNDSHGIAPTLFDPVAAAFAVRPDLCPMKPLRLEVDDKGMTRPVDGEPNAQVCLQSDARQFLDFYLSRVAPAAAAAPSAAVAQSANQK